MDFFAVKFQILHLIIKKKPFLFRQLIQNHNHIFLSKLSSKYV